MVRILLIDFVGACAGLMAISIGAHFQLVSHHDHSEAQTAALYLMGTILLLANLESIFSISRSWQVVRLLLYLVAIAISVSVWRDYGGGGSTALFRLQNCKLRNRDP